MTERKNEIILLKKNFNCIKLPIIEEWPISNYIGILEGIRNNLNLLWMNPQLLEKMSFPRYATMIGKNGELDLAIILGYES